MAIPPKKQTPKIVPMTKAAIMSGEVLIKNMPLPAAQAAKTPAVMAISPMGFLKASPMFWSVIRPEATGAKIAMVIIVMPIFRPLLSRAGNHVSSPNNLIISKTAAATETD